MALCREYEQGINSNSLSHCHSLPPTQQCQLDSQYTNNSIFNNILELCPSSSSGLLHQVPGMSNQTMSPTSLPTPAPSTEILPGKRVNSLTGQIDAAFALPPAAIANSNSDTTSVKSPSPVNSDSSYRPISPPSFPSASSRSEKAPAATRRRSSAVASQANASNQNAYTIPPPPTRSRKIIQMKPRGQEAHDESLDLAKNHPAIAPNSHAKDTKSATTAAGSKRKQSASGGPTTAAGRKIARKTAHSLIERRRRSKMNEEFGVLKNMIPACNGSDMHKLASKFLLLRKVLGSRY